MMHLLLLGAALAQSPVLDDGRAVREIISAQTFKLEQPYRYDWSAEHPPVREGLLLQLEVDPAWLIPSDTRQAVLYADHTPVERLNTGWPSGELWVVVPGATSADHLRLYFGGYELPERVTEAQGRATEAAAVAKGIQPLPLPKRGQPVNVRGQAELYGVVGR